MVARLVWHGRCLGQMVVYERVGEPQFWIGRGGYQKPECLPESKHVFAVGE